MDTPDLRAKMLLMARVYTTLFHRADTNDPAWARFLAWLHAVALAMRVPFEVVTLLADPKDALSETELREAVCSLTADAKAYASLPESVAENAWQTALDALGVVAGAFIADLPIRPEARICARGGAS